MADDDKDLGLGLRLPWGTVNPPADEAFAPPRSTGPPPDVTPGDGSGGDTQPPAEAPEAGPPADPIAQQPGVEAFLEAIDRRFDRLDERLAGLEHGLPERLDLVGARLAEAASSASASPPDRAVIERLERGFDRGVRLLEGRLERLEDRVASSNAATVEALRQVGGSGGMADESDADAVSAVLDRRLDRLETLVATFHETTMGALGRNHERLVAAVDASQATLIDRLAQLAPADLVTRLIQGVVTTGEMLDAELIDLQRLLADLRPPGP